MRRICVVITARPSYSRIKTALLQMQAHPGIELYIVVAASALLQRYGQVLDIIRADGFEVAAEVHTVFEGDDIANSVRSVGVGLIELASVFSRLKPDAVMTIADRYETIANAIAASYMNIPLIHIQGGECTGSIDNKVRHAITKLADLHFVASDTAKQRVITMGEDPECVANTGCPSIDLAAEVADSPALNFDPFAKYLGTGPTFDTKQGYLVVMQHPVTTEYEKALWQVNQTLDAVMKMDKPVFWFWPNVDTGSDGTSKALRMLRERRADLPFHFFKNMLPHDFLRLLCNGLCLIGNSSAGIREGAFLGIPVVNIGSRQKNRTRAANVLDVTYDSRAIYHAICQQSGHGHYPRSHIYGDGMAGQRIAELAATLPLTIDKKDFLQKEMLTESCS